MRRMKLSIREEKGSTFAYILVVMVVSFLLVAGLIQVTTSENNQVRYQTDHMKAYYIARAAAESMAMEMERMDNSYYEHFYDAEQVALAQDMLDEIGGAEVSVKRVSDQGHYRITSIGTYEDVSATVKIMMEYRERSELDFGVYAKDDMEDINNGSFDGDMGSGGGIEFHTGPDGDSPAEKRVTGAISEYTANNITITMPNIDSFYSHLEQPGIKLLKTAEVDDEYEENEYDDNHEIIKSTIIREWDNQYNKTLTVDTSSAEFYIKEGQDYEDTFSLSKTGSGDKWMVLYLEGNIPDNDNSNNNNGNNNNGNNNNSNNNNINSGSRIGSGADIKVTGNHNLMIIAEKGMNITGEITSSNNQKVSIYIMNQRIINKNNNEEADLILNMNNNIGIKDKPELFKIFLNPNVPLTVEVDTNKNFHGYIIGPEASINLDNGQTKVYGGIYGKNVSISSQAEFYQPGDLEHDITLYKQMGIAYWE